MLASCYTPTYRPEVVDQEIEYAQDHHKHHRAPLGLESNSNHDAGHCSDQNDQYTPETPFASEDESDKEEDQKHAPSKLKVHFAVLFVNLRESGGGKPLADPTVRQNHQESTHDGKVAKEEVQVEYKAVSKRLRNHNTQESRDGIFAVLSNDDEQRRRRHCNHIGNQEQVCDATGNYASHVSRNPQNPSLHG